MFENMQNFAILKVSTLCSNNNLAIANRSRVSCAHNISRASPGLITHDPEI